MLQCSQAEVHWRPVLEWSQIPLFATAKGHNHTLAHTPQHRLILTAHLRSRVLLTVQLLPPVQLIPHSFKERSDMYEDRDLKTFVMTQKQHIK